jgi:hypothetical protein
MSLRKKGASSRRFAEITREEEEEEKYVKINITICMVFFIVWLYFMTSTLIT